MATIQIKDANGATKYMQVNGSGTSGDPYRGVHDVNSNALPTGAATAANQSTTNTKLDTLHTDLGTTLHADLIAATPAGENHIGEVGANSIAMLAVTPVLDTSAYTAGDVLFPTITMGNVARANDKGFEIKGITAIEKADQAAADLELFFFRTNVALGTANSAPSITDGDAVQMVGYCKLATADWVDLGDVKVCHKSVSIAGVPTSGARTLFVAGVTGGTGTYAASDLVLNFLVEQH